MPGPLLSLVPRQISDWAKLAETQNLFRRIETEEKPKSQEWVFRGLSDGSYGLQTSLERVTGEFGVEGEFIPDLEVKLILEFTNQAARRQKVE